MADRFGNFRSDDGYPNYGGTDRRAPQDHHHDPRAHDLNPSDPLAELARLIGQSDPFSGRNSGERHHAGHAHPGPSPYRDDDPAPEWLTRPGHHAAGQDEDTSRYGSRDDPRGYDDPSHAEPIEFHDPRARDPRLTHPQAGEGGYAAQDAYSGAHPAMDRGARLGADAYDPHYPPQEHQGYVAPHYAVEAYDDPRLEAPDAYSQGQSPPPAYSSDPAYTGRGRAEDGQSFQDQGFQDQGFQDQGFQDQGFQDEAPAGRRRTGVVAAIAVVVVAVIGTAGAFGYRAFTGQSGKPPVIMAETGPNKVVPATSQDQGKRSYDRVTDRQSQGERVVSREEQPVEVKPPPRVVLQGGPAVQVPPPPPWNVATPAPTPVPSNAPSAPPAQPAAQVSPGQPTSVNEPRRVRTQSIRPDAPADPSARAGAPSAPSAAPAAPMRNTRVSSTAPMAIAPQSASPAAAEPAPAARTAALPPTRGDGNFMVQIASQKSESDAQASFRAMQQKYPGVLAGRSAVVRRADLGAKGIYYRAQIGPFGSQEQANEFCSSLKAAGGQCIIQRN